MRKGGKMSVTLNAFVLDYSPHWTALTQKVCKASGVNVLEWSRNGEAWKKSFELYKPHIVFVDLVMPNRDGLRCCRDILETNPTTGIILYHNFHTTVANNFDYTAAMMGVSAIVTKPFSEKKLIPVVNRVKEEVIQLQKAMGMIIS